MPDAINQNTYVWTDTGTKPTAGDESYVAGDQPIAEYDNWAMWAVTDDIDTLNDKLGNHSAYHEVGGQDELNLVDLNVGSAVQLAEPSSGVFDLQATDGTSHATLDLSADAWSHFPDIDDTISFKRDVTVGGGRSILVAEDSGSQTLVDMSVTGGVSAGGEQSYGFAVDGTEVGRVYAESDGSGGTQNHAFQFSKPVQFQTSEDFTLGDDLVATDGEVIWSESDGYILQGRLQNDSLTVTAGNGLKDAGTVALGSSMTMNIEPADFAGTFLTDDGADNLQVNIGEGLESNGAGSIRFDEDVGFSFTSELTFGAGAELGGDLNDGTNVVYDVSATEVPQARLGGPASSLSAYPLANSDIDNSSITVTAGNALNGGGTVSLGGSTSFSVGSSSIQTAELDLAIEPTWTGVHTFDNGIQFGAGDYIDFADNDGITTVMDMNISSASTGGTEQSLTFRIDSGQFFKLYSEADGAGGIQNQDVRVLHPLNVNGNDIVDAGTTVWDTSAGYIPQDRLQNDQIMINAGSHLSTTDSSPALGGSATLDVDDDFVLNTGDTITGNLTVSADIIGGSTTVWDNSNNYVPESALQTLSNGALTNSSVVINGGTDINAGSVSLGGTVTVDHANTSSQGDVTTGGATVIDDLYLDGRGHLTNINTEGRSLDDWGDANSDVSLDSNRLTNVNGITAGSSNRLTFEDDITIDGETKNDNSRRVNTNWANRTSWMWSNLTGADSGGSKYHIATIRFDDSGWSGDTNLNRFKITSTYYQQSYSEYVVQAGYHDDPTTENIISLVDTAGDSSQTTQLKIENLNNPGSDTEVWEADIYLYVRDYMHVNVELESTWRNSNDFSVDPGSPNEGINVYTSPDRTDDISLGSSPVELADGPGRSATIDGEKVATERWSKTLNDQLTIESGRVYAQPSSAGGSIETHYWESNQNSGSDYASITYHDDYYNYGDNDEQSALEIKVENDANVNSGSAGPDSLVLDVSGYVDMSNTETGMILPTMSSDPNNPDSGTMWYRDDLD